MGRSIGSYQRRWNAYPRRRPIASSSMGSGLTYFARRAGFKFEGLVSKRRDRPYQAGRSEHWGQDQKP